MAKEILFPNGQILAVALYDGLGNPIGSTGDSLKTTGGGGGGGGAVTIADGADVTEGAIADAAVVGDSAGTVSAKLRGMIKIFNDVWDSAGHQLKTSASVTVPTPLTVALNVLASTTGTIANVGDAVLLAVPTGALWYRIKILPVNSLLGSMQFEFSKDGGATYNSNYSPGAKAYTTFSSGGPRGAFQDPSYDGSNQTLEIWLGPLDRNITHVRYACTSRTSGTLPVELYAVNELPELDRMALAPVSNAGSQWSSSKGGVVMVGATDGSNQPIPLPANNGTGSISQFDKFVNVGLAVTSSVTAFNLRDKNANGIDSATSNPVGTERGIITRPIIGSLTADVDYKSPTQVTGTIAGPADTIIIDCSNAETVLVIFDSGIAPDMTVGFNASWDGVNYTPDGAYVGQYLSFVGPTDPGTWDNKIHFFGVYTPTPILRFPCAGFKNIKISAGGSYNSGSVHVVLNASAGRSDMDRPYQSPNSPLATQVFGVGSLSPVDASSISPFGSEMGLVVRNIPSGTQPVSISGGLEVSALVSDSRESYNDSDVKPLSLTTDGRLRVATSPSDYEMDFFDNDLVPENFLTPNWSYSA